MRRRAFTLLELVVTAAIISLLVAVTLPALGRAQTAARRATCASQVRALVLGAACYAQESAAWLPPGPREIAPDGRFAADPDRGSPIELFSSLRIGRTDLSSQSGWYGQGLLWARRAVDQPRQYYCPEMERKGWGMDYAWPRHMEVAPERAGEKATVSGSYVYRGGYASAAGTTSGTLSTMRHATGEPVFADSPFFGTMAHHGGYTVGYLGGQVEFRTFAKPAVTGTAVTPFWTAVGPTAASAPAPAGR